MRPKPVKATVTTTEDTVLFGSNLRYAYIENTGGTKCQIDFDASISSDSFTLAPGQFIEMGFTFVRMYHKTASGSTTLQIIKIYQ